MGFKCGIVGLPNVGKSTLFNVLTKAGAVAANFPFSTIKPNIGIVPVPDLRLNQLAEIVKPRKILPTTMEFVDIAGLVKGASKGEGLGNQFLKNIRAMEAIAHVVRCFEQENIIHVTGQVNPKKDISTINTELVLSDLDICERAIYCTLKKAKRGDKDAKVELAVLEQCLLCLEQGKMLRLLELSKEEKKSIHYLSFLTLKPVMYIANVNENAPKSNSYFDQVRFIAKQEGSVVVQVCATAEADIIKLNDKERSEFMNLLGFLEPGLNRIIRAGYCLLNLQTYFTAGTKEVRAWTIPFGATAPQAAGRIHTDFEKGFIRAETIAFKDFISYGGKQGAKEAGKMRLEGKDYIVKDGDVMHFLFKV